MTVALEKCEALNHEESVGLTCEHPCLYLLLDAGFTQCLFGCLLGFDLGCFSGPQGLSLYISLVFFNEHGVGDEAGTGFD